ncbi:MAG: hypothetical protein JNM93_12505 [Bacteriovoracaceae bacterium]|nr:hypothetical protein [Bacteriovoracaceae bacterium]
MSLNKFVERTKNQYFASCPVGLEQLLEKELKSFGIEDYVTERGGISFVDKEYKYLEVLLHSRIASRLFQSLYTATIRHEKDLYKVSNNIDWDHLMRMNQTFKIKTIFSGTKDRGVPIKNSLICSQIFKDGMVDFFNSKYGKRPDVDVKHAQISLLLHISPDTQDRLLRAHILVDLGGEPLSNRSYRRGGFEAPLRENLAAGLVQMMEIDFDKETFVDTMCGSGTVLIEAAMMAHGISPSYFKIKNYPEYTFAIEQFIPFMMEKENIEVLNKMKAEASKFTLNPKRIVYGFDDSVKSLRECSDNIFSSGLDSVIKVKKEDATELKPFQAPHVLFCNPPYAKRMGEEDGLEQVYHNYGENLKHEFKGDRAYVFTGNPELAKKISLRTSKRIILFNGSIECRLLEYKLF